jgi:hypothetical protein
MFQDLRLLGQTQHGVYDEAESVDPILLHRYYGAARSGAHNHSNGTDQDLNGNLPDDSSSDFDSDADSNSGNRSSSNPHSGPNSDSTSNSTGSTPDPTDSNDSYESGSDGDGNGDDHEDDHKDDNESNVGENGKGCRYNNNGNNFNVSFTLTTEQGDERTHSWEAIADIIADCQKHNVRHDAAEVAKGAFPFEDEGQLDMFLAAFQATLDSATYPAGFGLDEEYESSESYKTGRSRNPLVIPLPYSVWFPRIVVWCKALDLLKRLSAFSGL